MTLAENSVILLTTIVSCQTTKKSIQSFFLAFYYFVQYLRIHYSVYLYSNANSFFASRLLPSPHSGSIRKNVARDNVLTWNYSSTGKIDHSSFSYVLMKLLLQQTN